MRRSKKSLYFFMLVFLCVLGACAFNVDQQEMVMMSGHQLCLDYTSPNISESSKQLINAELNRRNIECDILAYQSLHEGAAVDRRRQQSSLIMNFASSLARIFTPY